MDKWDKCIFKEDTQAIPWRRAWQPTPLFLPGKFQGLRRLPGYMLLCGIESDMTEHTYMLIFITEIDEIETRKAIVKSVKENILFLKKINKIDKLSARLTNKRREMIQINKIRNERRSNTIDNS